MSTQLSHQQFKGIPSIVLQNQQLRCEWLPSYGSKLCSLKRNHDGQWRELLWQSQDLVFNLPSYGDDFSQFDSSGFDECFPTINQCPNPIDPSELEQIPDHGEVWSLAWKIIEQSDEKIVFEVYSPHLGYVLRKSVHIDEDKLIHNYQVKLDDKANKLPFIWTPHALFAVNSNLSIDVPNRMRQITNTFDGCPSLGKYQSQHCYPETMTVNAEPLNLSKLRAQSTLSCEKYYFDEPLRNDDSFGFSDDYHQVLMQVSADTIPYLGVWKNQGAYKGDYNFALEPCSGIYDSVDDAYRHKRCKVLQPSQTMDWNFTIQVLPRASLNHDTTIS